RLPHEEDGHQPAADAAAGAGGSAAAGAGSGATEAGASPGPAAGAGGAGAETGGAPVAGAGEPSSSFPSTRRRTRPGRDAATSSRVVTSRTAAPSWWIESSSRSPSGGVSASGAPV